MAVRNPFDVAMPETREKLGFRGSWEGVALRDSDKWNASVSRMVTVGDAPAALAHLAKPGQE